MQGTLTLRQVVPAVVREHELCQLTPSPRTVATGPRAPRTGCPGPGAVPGPGACILLAMALTESCGSGPCPGLVLAAAGGAESEARAAGRRVPVTQVAGAQAPSTSGGGSDEPESARFRVSLYLRPADWLWQGWARTLDCTRWPRHVSTEFLRTLAEFHGTSDESGLRGYQRCRRWWSKEFILLGMRYNNFEYPVCRIFRGSKSGCCDSSSSFTWSPSSWHDKLHEQAILDRIYCLEDAVLA